jgi:tRNA dimethylallyltransferase
MSTKENKLKPLVVILGPTAVGKTDLAIKLAKKFNGEIISADSRTIYKGMDIGTAKPKNLKPCKKNRWCVLVENIPHYFIDVVEPDEIFTVAQFKKQALKIIKKIYKKNKIPFLVGGTGLYISALVENYKIPKVPPDFKLRKKFEEEAKKYGPIYLYKKLLKIDPEAKKFVDKNNLRRIIRALEVSIKLKKPFSQVRKRGKPLFRTLKIGLILPKNLLYQRISERTEKMIKEGLVEEVKKIYQKLYKKFKKKYKKGVEKKIWQLPSMTGISYKEIGLYLQNKITLNEAIELIKKNNQNYAKRQLTWFKKDKEIIWISPNDVKKIENLIKNFLKEN